MIEPEISDTRCYVVARIERRESRGATAVGVNSTRGAIVPAGTVHSGGG